MTLSEKFEAVVLVWVAGLVAASFGLTLAPMVADSSLNVRDSFNMVMQWLVAVGTVGATVTALWLGLSNQQEQAKRDYDSAVLVAAGIIPVLEVVNKKLRRIQVSIGAFNTRRIFGARPNVQRVAKYQDLVYEELQRAVSLPMFVIEVNTAVQLIPLCSRVAQSFFAGVSLVNHIEREAFSGASNRRWAQMSIEDRFLFLQSIKSQLVESLAFLDYANAEFTKATVLSKVKPTLVELHGMNPL